MALFLFNGNGSSRFNLLLLITLVLVCFCSSSPSIYDIDSSTDDIDDEMNYYVPLRRYITIPEARIVPSKDPLHNLLLRSIVIQPTYRHNEYNNKRYASQAFHAMRG